jgi:hypothetical protein
MARTFKQQGQGFGSSTVNITATIDGIQVYNGPINTIDQDPSDTYTGTMVDLFTWEIADRTFTGTQSMQITVTGGSALMLGDSLANYTNLMSVESSTQEFGGFYYEFIDGVNFGDPLSAVTIDGVAHTRQTDLPGQWYWVISSGTTFSCTVNINTGGGDVIPLWDNTQTYAEQKAVQQDGAVYVSIQAVPAGTPVTDTAYWQPNLA